MSEEKRGDHYDDQVLAISSNRNDLMNETTERTFDNTARSANSDVVFDATAKTEAI